MEPNTSTNSTIIKIIAGVAVLGLVVFGFWKLNTQEAEAPLANNEQEGSVETVTTTTTTEVTESDNRYRNGTYTASGMYSSPAGQEDVQITLTLTNDIVTSATFVGKATNPGSVKMQDNFRQGFSQYVVGKNIDEVNVGVVNGSSLTGKGFMDAVAKIKVEAEA